MLQSDTDEFKLATSNSEQPTSLSDLPPFLRSWRRIYSIVVGELALLVLLFYLFSRVYQ